MRATFTASQSVQINVPSMGVSIRHYLRQPHRVVHALADDKQLERLSETCYRFKMKSRQFLHLNLQPIVDIQLQPKADGTVFLESQRCELQGIEFINQRFELGLVGILQPIQQGTQTILAGHADLQVDVDVPPLLWMTPKAILETTGNSLLKSVLLTVKQRLIHHLIQDYQTWAAQEETLSAFSYLTQTSIRSSSI
jgi:Protein of unknown function (DUF1997)